MKKLSKTLTELGIDCAFPIEIEDDNGRPTYFEDSDGFWRKREFDANGNQTYFGDSNGYWYKRECDSEGRPLYHEDSNDFWQKWERDADGDVLYYEDSTGVKKGTPMTANQ